MFRHVVLLRWVDATSPERIAAVTDALRGLPEQIPEIARYTIGTDAGINAENADLAVVADFADFADRAAYLTYRDHPVHRAVIDELITPILAGRTALQFDVDADA